ncbi:nitrate assimilation regulatory nirA [Fusarium mundagurra]|uniref:Nitrate assimilation regulatory nirA n=1 Tax=Fusarium mundagurra TaxID=1567541 RepID=A0A8H5XNS9_9HYPO|nr:nitrate assimilation regulatory nirA [Fusarium mundagurra]
MVSLLFPVIQPAAQQPSQHHNFAGFGGAGGSCERLGKRIRSVRQACQDCRQGRVKCDGRRPQCDTCIAKGRSCRYESQQGHSSKAVLKSRLHVLEKLFFALQAKPGDEADRLLQQIRCADDFRTLLDFKDDMPPLDVSSSTSISPSDSSLSSSTIGFEEQRLGSVTPAQNSATVPRLQEPQVGDDTLGKAGVLTPFPALRELAVDASAFLISVIIPSASTTQAAVDSFFSSSGKLFHVFSREQVSGYYKDVFGRDCYSIPRQKTAICCLAAVAAVGVQYNAGDFEVAIEGVFYDLARQFFGSFMEEQPLDAIKVCALLAMYNIMNKATVSLAYIVVQTEMTKISLLNADILRMHLSFQELPSQAIDSISKDLQDWHNQLPKQIHLSNLSREDLPVEVRRTILATHLLYLGATMLLYRRIASQFVRRSGIHHGHGILWQPIENAFLNHVDQGVTAARHSARMLGLLRAEAGIFKRCWLVIFQAYTSCVVLLHSVAQKQVHLFPRSFWEDDLAQARICLDIVSFCGTVDPVALKFQDCLVPIHDKLASYILPTTSISTPPYPSSLAYILGIPTTADADRAGLSLKLLIILCQPFGNADSNCGSNGNLSTLWQSFPTQYEQVQGAERFDWKINSCPPFRWDPQGLGIGEAALLESDNRFLGSNEPSGWTGVQSEDGDELEWVMS